MRVPLCSQNQWFVCQTVADWKKRRKAPVQVDDFTLPMNYIVHYKYPLMMYTVVDITEISVQNKTMITDFAQNIIIAIKQ